MAANSKRSTPNETKFTEAEKNWNLEKLYEDLRGKKQKVLTDTEKCHLRGLLCGYSPQEIADKRVIAVGTVNDALSKTLYRYIEDLLNREKKIRHWSHVPDFLEKAGYKIQVSEQSQSNHSLTSKNDNTLEISHNTESNSIREWHFKSVDQLWSKDIGERISGIRKLERIAKDYPTEHWAIMEELAEFIRIKAPRQEGEEERSPKLLDDVQAALRVIGGRESKKDPPKQRLDLRNIDIRGAKLNGANLQRVNFNGANLKKVIFNGANLQRAQLMRANLQEAQLIRANLQWTFLNRTELQGAILQKAKLQRAFLKGANLQGAFLSGADFSGASIESCQIESADGDSTTRLPKHLNSPTHWMQAAWDKGSVLQWLLIKKRSLLT